MDRETCQRESVSVDKLHSPVQDANEALQDAKAASHGHIPRVGFRLLCNRADLSEHVDDSNDETAETDRAKAVRQGATRGTPSCSRWRVSGREEPRGVHSAADRVDGVLEPFGNPVRGEGEVDEEPNDDARAAVAAGAACGIRTGFVLCVDGHQLLMS